MRLRALVGPYFWRNELPFSWQDDAIDAFCSDWEMSRYLTVLADFESSHGASDEVTSVHNAKLDLALLWMARSLQMPLPPECEVMMGLESVTWFSVNEISVQQLGQVQFCLSSQFPLLLQLPVRVVSCEVCQDGYQITAQWSGLSEVLLDLLEKTVFRYHRRQINTHRDPQC